jgi:tRNA dimethylallyltransferase
VCVLTGQPMSNSFVEQKSVLPYKVIAIGLEPSDRSVLHKRIAQRFGRMLDKGLIDEVRELRRRFALTPTLPSMRCVGYRQTWQHLDGEFDRDALREKGVAATRQLAKRQLTWLRAMKEVQRYDCLAPDLQRQVLAHLQQALNAVPEPS